MQRKLGAINLCEKAVSHGDAENAEEKQQLKEWFKSLYPQNIFFDFKVFSV